MSPSPEQTRKKVGFFVTGVTTTLAPETTPSTEPTSCPEGSSFGAVNGGRTVKHVMTRNGIMTNPAMRNVHPKPISVWFRRLFSRIGQIIPPVEDPAIAIPIANALFFL